MNTLNGWQRLWAFLGVIWLGLVVSVSVLLWMPRRVELDPDVATTMPLTARQQEAILMTLLAWLLPMVTVYALGMGIAWVRRGFFPRRHLSS